MLIRWYDEALGLVDLRLQLSERQRLKVHCVYAYTVYIQACIKDFLKLGGEKIGHFAGLLDKK